MNGPPGVFVSSLAGLLLAACADRDGGVPDADSPSAGSADTDAGQSPLEGDWVAAPCQPDQICSVVGFDPDELGPGIENAATDELGRLVVIGRFLGINGTAAERIARWDGTAWT